jgi:hypothetical protein
VAGPSNTDRRRLKRKRWHILLRENWYRDVWLFLITGLVLAAILISQHEARQREDQTCTLFERNYRDAVQQLQQTYDYIGGLNADDLKQSLNKAVLANIPLAERRAKNVVPPAYCNPDDTGLPGKNPEIPKRPKGLEPLLAPLR